MIKVQLQASAKLAVQLHSSEYTTTREDMPPTEPVMIAGIPRVGDYVFQDDGRSWQVERVYFKFNDEVVYADVT